VSRRIRTTVAIAAAVVALVSVAAAGSPARSPRVSVAPVSGVGHLPRGERLLSTPREVERALGPPAGTVYATPVHNARQAQIEQLPETTLSSGSARATHVPYAQSFDGQ
jgi:hypothetical protein